MNWPAAGCENTPGAVFTEIYGSLNPPIYVPGGMRMLSTTAEYALRIMIALSEAPAGAVTSEKISRITQVPTDYAVKVLQQLGRAGLVKAQRGRGGGFG